MKWKVITLEKNLAITPRSNKLKYFSIIVVTIIRLNSVLEIFFLLKKLLLIFASMILIPRTLLGIITLTMY